MDNHGNKPNGNGSVGIGVPLAQIPIVGQPCEIKAWFVTVLLACHCGAHEPVLIAGKVGAVGQCPACKKAYVVQGMTSTPGSAHVNFNIGVGLPTADPG